MKISICKHCKEEFDLSDKTKGWMANHSRWCDKNPKRNEYNKNLEYQRSKITETSRQKMREGVSRAHKRGAYSGSSQKGLETKIRNGNLHHTEESKEKIKAAALASKHRRLKKNTIQYKGVTLDSRWELYLAERLDSLGIKWIRPEPLPWTDNNGYTHNYFPDFYLPEYDLYLDPKNPYAVKVQKEKLDVILKKYKNITIIETEQGCKQFTI